VLFDMMWTVYQETGATGDIYIVCGYRSPETNSMLRRRSKGVAKNSQHTRGKAMDYFIPGVPLEKLRVAGLRMQIGGVGYYPTSGSPFVHMDTGSVRHWPRMTREQLVRVFPNGRTLHVPSDGKPLPGYEIALAEYKARGSVSSSSVQIAAASVSTPANTAPAAIGSRPNGLLTSFTKPRPAPAPTAAPAEPGADEPELVDELATASVTSTPRPRPEPVRLAELIERNADLPPPEGTTSRRYMLVGKANPGKSILQRVALAFGGEDTPAPKVAEAPAAAPTAAPMPEPAERAMAFAASGTTSGPDPLRLMRAETSPAPAQEKPRAEEAPVTTAALPPAEPSRPANILHDPAPRLAFVAAQADWGRTLWTVKASTRHRNFAELMMPDPEADPTILNAPARVVVAGFSAKPYGALRTDHFTGVVAEPISTIDFTPARRFALMIER
jgi:hypothetical protein